MEKVSIKGQSSAAISQSNVNFSNILCQMDIHKKWEVIYKHPEDSEERERGKKIYKGESKANQSTDLSSHGIMTIATVTAV